MADDPDTILKKLKKAITATEGGAKAPGAQNLLLLLEHFGGSNYQDFAKAEKAGTIQYGDLKQALAEAIADTFALSASAVKNCSIMKQTSWRRS